MREVLSFEDLIHPIEAEKFLAEFWERRHLHVARNQPELFENLLSIHDLDFWMKSNRGGPEGSVVVTQSGGVPGGRWRPQDLVMEEVFGMFSRGHSVVLNYLESSWPPLFGLVTAVKKFFYATVGVNAYLTPSSSQAFPLHTDEHDVFVIQLQGEKIWQLHEMRTLGIMDMSYRRDLTLPGDLGPTKLDGPVLAKLTLQPGDILYIPRGMPHCAATKDSTSLHLTISLTSLAWLDFVKAAVEQASLHSVELRRALPVGFLEQPEMAATMRQGFFSALQAFQDQVCFEETFELVARNRVRTLGSAPDGHFGQLIPETLESIQNDTLMERRPGLLCLLEPSADSVVLTFGGREFRGPARLSRAFAFVCDHERFRVDEIPSLDDQGQMVLVKRLVRAGLLRRLGGSAGGRRANST